MAKTQESKSSGGLVALLIPAVLAIGGGAGLGLFIGEQQLKGAQPQKEAHAAPPAPVVEAPAAASHGGDAHHDGGEHKEAKPSEAASKLQLKVLPSIVTNLGEPAKALVRLQSAIVYDPAKLQNPDIFIAQLSEDIAVFFKTLSISSIEGAEGLRQLNEDLKDRAAIRSNQAVQEFIIQSVVVQ